jgi:hypothetical protein
MKQQYHNDDHKSSYLRRWQRFKNRPWSHGFDRRRCRQLVIKRRR